MNEEVINYHKQRRPFVIIPDVGIIVAHSGQPFAHIELLTNCCIEANKAKEIIETCPRGYFLDNKLVMYQGENVAEGECWELKPENFVFVRSFYADLRRIFNFNAKTKVFLGVKRGKIGEIWPVIDEVNQDFFI